MRTAVPRFRPSGAFVCALLVLAALVSAGGRTATAEDVFTVHLATPASGGDDAHDGLSPDSAVSSLARAEQVLRAHDPGTDVEIRIEQGTYLAPPGHWHFYVPGHTVTFLPADYEYGEGRDGIAGLPVFRNEKDGDGNYPAGAWLQPRLPTDTAHPLHDGGNSGLRFYYLRVEYYNSGLSIYGDSGRDVLDERYDPPLRVRGSRGLNGNTVFGMVFHRLGSEWTGGKYGYGAIILTNSSNNRIVNNHFSRIENVAPYPNHIHGIYITHFSSHNEVMRNSFRYNSGDPVKVRNLSNFNRVEDNTFERTGRIAYYREQFCDTECAVRNNHRQCASYGNRFAYNRLVSHYSGGWTRTWALDPPGLRYAGAEPCSIPAGRDRLHTAGNGNPRP